MIEPFTSGNCVESTRKPEKSKSAATSRTHKLRGAVFALVTSITALLHSVTSAQIGRDPDAPLTEIEEKYPLVIEEIRQMVSTPETEVSNFIVKHATPNKIDEIFKNPEATKLPTIIKTNGLIFVGRSQTPLTFEKPSDILNKIKSWFPEEYNNIQKGTSPSIRDKIHLFGPYENWEAEPTAFLSLWNCTPIIAWVQPDINPFSRPSEWPSLYFPLTWDRLDYEEYDFKYCLNNMNGYVDLQSNEAKLRSRQSIQRIAAKVTPILQRKFDAFLKENHCNGTGPDDCVLIMRQWASLAPFDENLASTIQRLEPALALNTPLPALVDPNVHYISNQNVGVEYIRFDAGLRRAAFLRAKLQSVLSAKNAWPSDALQITFQQLTKFRQDYVGPHNLYYTRYGIYERGELNPWRIFYSDEYKVTGETKSAVLNELDRISNSRISDCDVSTTWFAYSGSLFLNEYILRQLRREDKNAMQCATPDFAWLRDQANTEFRHILYGYLAISDYLPEQDKNKLMYGLTRDSDGKSICNTHKKPNIPGWLAKICNKERNKTTAR